MFSPPPPLVFTVKTNVERTGYAGASQSSELDSVSVLDTPSPSQNVGEPVEVRETVYEEKENIDVKDLPVIRAEGLETITPRELSFNVEVHETGWGIYSSSFGYSVCYRYLGVHA